MATTQAFGPDRATVNLTVTAASGRVQVLSAAYARHVRLYNAGPATVFVAFGTVAVVAAVATGMPIPPGAVEVVTSRSLYVAGITESGSATLYCTVGEGI
jgi:hypothetical protein